MEADIWSCRLFQFLIFLFEPVGNIPFIEGKVVFVRRTLFFENLLPVILHTADAF
jgi:hypothetical protein